MAQPHDLSPRPDPFDDEPPRHPARLALGLAVLAAVDLWLLARLGSALAALPEELAAAPLALLALVGAAGMAAAGLLLTRLWLDDLLASLSGDAPF